MKFRKEEPLIGYDRTCNECGCEKDLSLFPKCPRNKEGRSWQCKDCKARYMKDWYNEKTKTERKIKAEKKVEVDSSSLSRGDFYVMVQRAKKLDGKTRERYGHMCTTCDNPQVIMELEDSDERENVYSGVCNRCGSNFVETVNLKSDFFKEKNKVNKFLHENVI
jgi:hypothetical protein